MGIVTSAHYATVDPIVDATPSRLALNELLRIQLCTLETLGWQWQIFYQVEVEDRSPTRWILRASLLGKTWGH